MAAIMVVMVVVVVVVVVVAAAAAAAAVYTVEIVFADAPAPWLPCSGHASLVEADKVASSCGSCGSCAAPVDVITSPCFCSFVSCRCFLFFFGCG